MLRNALSESGGAPGESARNDGWTLRRVLRAIFIGVPLRLGRLAQKIGLKLDDIASWLIGTAIIIVVILAVLGLVNALDVVNLIKRALGIQ